MKNYVFKFGKFKLSEQSQVVIWTTFIKMCIELTAIVIGGWWAYSRFFQTEAPMLEAHGEIETQLQWINSKFDTSKFYNVVFSVAVKNIGKHSFDIDTILLKTWVLSLVIDTSRIAYINPEIYMNGRSPDINKVFAHGESDTSIIGHYPPDFSMNDHYEFSVLKQPKYLYFFRFTAIAHSVDKEMKKIIIDDYEWSNALNNDNMQLQKLNTNLLIRKN